MENDGLLPQVAVKHLINRVSEVMEYASSRPGVPVLVGGGTWEPRTQVMKALADARSLYYLPLGLELSKALQRVPPGRRALKVVDAVRTLSMPPEGSGLKGCAMDQIEVLFLPDLRVNVLSLLKRIARERLLVVSWPGIRKGREFVYAVPGHPEYQHGRDDNIIYVSLEA